MKRHIVDLHAQDCVSRRVLIHVTVVQDAPINVQVAGHAQLLVILHVKVNVVDVVLVQDVLKHVQDVVLRALVNVKDARMDAVLNVLVDVVLVALETVEIIVKDRLFLMYLAMEIV